MGVSNEMCHFMDGVCTVLGENVEWKIELTSKPTSAEKKAYQKLVDQWNSTRPLDYSKWPGTYPQNNYTLYLKRNDEVFFTSEEHPGQRADLFKPEQLKKFLSTLVR